MRKFVLLIFLGLYLIGTACWSIYHALNFSNYVHRKGGETIDYTLYLLMTSILFQVIVWIVSRVLVWKLAMLATAVNYIVSFVLGFAILMLSGLSGIPKHLIFIYGGCFMTIFSVVTIRQLSKMSLTVASK